MKIFEVTIKLTVKTPFNLKEDIEEFYKDILTSYEGTEWKTLWPINIEVKLRAPQAGARQSG